MTATGAKLNGTKIYVHENEWHKRFCAKIIGAKMSGPRARKVVVNYTQASQAHITNTHTIG